MFVEELKYSCAASCRGTSTSKAAPIERRMAMNSGAPVTRDMMSQVATQRAWDGSVYQALKSEEPIVQWMVCSGSP